MALIVKQSQETMRHRRLGLLLSEFFEHLNFFGLHCKEQSVEACSNKVYI